ncbi:MAG: 4Fe-4S binding protein [Campylobacterales bacterium]|jgi:formate hydrogenlyase subunit 6/NADH:ubiquinone oxidoreductase subunit I
MAGITLNPGRCVRQLSTLSTCDSCITACPTEALVKTENVPAVNLGACVGCGSCAGACPTEAIGVDDFSATDFFFAFAGDSDNLISCRKNVPCIAALSVDHLLSLASLKGGLRLDTGHCDGCEIAPVCRAQFEARVEEASYLLEAMESRAGIVCEDVAYEDGEVKEEGDRRDFLRSFNLKSLAEGKAKFEREVETATDELIRHQLDSTAIAQLRTKTLPDKRKLLFTALKRAERPSQYHVVESDELTLASQKIMDADACTACQMCYRICPTGALTSDLRNSKIDFDAMMCVRCHLCHDVCEPDALTLSPSFNMKELFEPTQQRLVAFTVRNCDECGNPFTSLGGERICHRCRIEEEEARTLWGIGENE